MTMSKVQFFILVITAWWLVAEIKSVTSLHKVLTCKITSSNNPKIECDKDLLVDIRKVLYGRTEDPDCRNRRCSPRDITNHNIKPCSRGGCLLPLSRSIGIFDKGFSCSLPEQNNKYIEVFYDCCPKCPPGKFGCHHCLKLCHCKDGCHSVTGQCDPGCDSGWKGFNCQDCEDGKFGPNCARDCHCQKPCDQVSGNCPANCEKGWQGNNCQQACLDGKFGLHCTKYCHCQDPCDKVSGRCPTKCVIGWQGRECQECSDGWFGPNCLKDCHCQDICDKKTGICPSNCTSGWQGVDCQECTNGTFGLNCSKDCHCEDVCDPANGSCPTNCEIGWRGVDCQEECSDGTFGVNCARDCHCQDTCDKKSGRCPSKCETGWQGGDCQECQDGKFGPDCRKDCHCRNPADICDRDTGSCATGCHNGWRGSDCQQPDCSFNDPCGIHTCQESDDHFSCSCLQGYENSNPLACKDIDECARGDVCGIHTCKNEQGSYKCICCNDSYENISPQTCVPAMVLDFVKNEELFVPGDIALPAMVGVTVLTTQIIVFIAIVVIQCAITVARSVNRYVYTEPEPDVELQFIMKFHRVIVSNLHGYEDDDTISV